MARSGAWLKKTSLIVVRGLVATRHSRGARLIEQARMLEAEQGEQAHEVPGREDVEQAELVEDAGPAAVALGGGAGEPLLVGLGVGADLRLGLHEQGAEEGEHAEGEDDPQAGAHRDEEEPDSPQRVVLVAGAVAGRLATRRGRRRRARCGRRDRARAR